MSYGENFTIYMYCRNADEARSHVECIQSVCGSYFEQDGSFIYVVIDCEQIEEAHKELDGDGYQFDDKGLRTQKEG